MRPNNAIKTKKLALMGLAICRNYSTASNNQAISRSLCKPKSDVNNKRTGAHTCLAIYPYRYILSMGGNHRIQCVTREIRTLLGTVLELHSTSFTKCVKLNKFAQFKKENLSSNEFCTMQQIALKSIVYLQSYSSSNCGNILLTRAHAFVGWVVFSHISVTL
jgi:hypothetical protein